MKNFGGQMEEQFLNPYEYSNPPEGWQNLTEISRKLKRNSNTVRELLERALEKTPEQGGMFLGKDSMVHQYFSPAMAEEVERALKEMDEYKLPPEGWANLKELGLPIFNNENLTPKRTEMIREAAESFRAEHPEWFKRFNPTGGFETDYYDPELVQKIIEIVKAKEAKYSSKLQRPEQ